MDDDRLRDLSERLSILLDKQQPVRAGGRGEERVREYGRFMALVEAYSQWRYENPVKSLVIRLISGGASCAALLLSLWWVAGTGVGEATGLQSLRTKATNIYYAILWSTRGDVDAALVAQMAPQRFPGTIEQVIDGVLVVSYYEAGKQYRRLVKPANVIMTDKKGFELWAKQYLLKGVTFDFYIPLEEIKGHKVWAAVIWYRKTPVNVELVERSLGYPEKNPPTAVVNQVFSQYYWNLARGS